MRDKDLASVQETRMLVEKAWDAQGKYCLLDQHETDRVVEALAKRLRDDAQMLGKIAAETTGFGRWQDKTTKNIIASEMLYNHIKGIRTRGIISEDTVNKVYEVAVPFGVVAGIIPTTNPTSTVIFKTLISLKAGNAIVFSPHPGALVCIMKTVEVIRDELSKIGSDPDLVSCISLPTMEATNALMRHPKISLILATGGSAMVRSAYSSGKPALGVGPGNVPAYIEKSANIAKAVADIFCSKTFDNGTICASEQSIIAEEAVSSQVKRECEKQGGYFLKGEELLKVQKILVNNVGGFNAKIVGRDAMTLASMAGINIPEGSRVLLAETNGVGKDYPYSMEKLTSILAFYVVKDIEDAKKRAYELLSFGGLGHSCVMHSQNEEAICNFALAMPVSRMLINTPSSQGAVGFTTGLAPSFTLGCGSYGGNATSDNIGTVHLFNRTKIAYGLKDISEIEYVSENTKSSEDYFNEIYKNVRRMLNET